MERNSVIFVPINKIAYRYLLQKYIIIYFLQKNPQIFLFFRLHCILGFPHGPRTSKFEIQAASFRHGFVNEVYSK